MAEGARQKASNLRDQLAQLTAYQPPPTTTSTLSDMPIQRAETGPDPIQTALNQNLNRIQATGATAQPQTYTKTYTTTQNNGDLVKETIVHREFGNSTSAGLLRGYQFTNQQPGCCRAEQFRGPQPGRARRFGEHQSSNGDRQCWRAQHRDPKGIRTFCGH